MHASGVQRIRIALDAKQKMRRHQHGLNRQLDSLFVGLAVRLGQLTNFISEATSAFVTGRRYA